MAKKTKKIPEYGTVTRNGAQYYRTRITDADGKRVDLYALTREELFQKEQEARAQVKDAIFRQKIQLSQSTVKNGCLCGRQRYLLQP